MLHFSFIIPVYNRPKEIEELLASMLLLKNAGSFEAVLVEDGSTETSESIVETYKEKLPISYYSKENTGPGDSRNYGMQKAKGDYFIILDSDVLLPANYLERVHAFLEQQFVHCFGGPDAADSSFTTLQKAISYSMTSLWTTGGIRGRAKAVQKFQPRSFNMGLSKEAFQASGGFGKIHPGEDPDLAIRLWKLGYETALIADAAVFHKRRISWPRFYQQVLKFGLARPILNLWHPETAKITFWFPIVFCSYVLIALVLACFGWFLFLQILFLYFLLIFIGASWQYHSFSVGFKAVIATLVQFYGYGTGFFKSYYYIHLRKKQPEKQFKHLFFD